MIKNGNLVISLDFELLWGVFDMINYNSYRQYFINTRVVIPKILDLFEKFNINATWAIVGMLYNENWEQWESNIPNLKPEYIKKNLSAYSFGNSIKNNNTESLCFAPDLIKLISKTPGQEIATHTYSHYYCLEEGQDIHSFHADLETALRMAKNIGISIESLVFPRNQFQEGYLKVCKKLGILNVRSNPAAWYWKNVEANSLLTKIARTGDAYIPIGKKSYKRDILTNKPSIVVEQKASRFLRPVEGNYQLRKLKIIRILKEMSLAARNKEIYHLWWHPHNFGSSPNESLEDLIIILEKFRHLNLEYNFKSANMRQIGQFPS